MSMECLATCYRTFVSRIVAAISSLTPCLTQLSSCMEAYKYPPRRGSKAADQMAASLHLGIPKQLPQDQISSKLELEHDLWVRSGVLEYLDSRSENTQRPRARAQPRPCQGPEPECPCQSPEPRPCPRVPARAQSPLPDPAKPCQAPRL